MNSRAACVVAWASWVLFAFLVAGCANVRERPHATPDFARDVRPILESRCGRCHGPSGASADWNASRFTDVIACIPSRSDAGTSAADGGAWPSRLAAALARADHQGLLDATQLEVLNAWIEAGAAASRGSMHDLGFADPRSVNFHASSLRRARWAPMLDATRADACGRCHEGAPARPAGITEAARGAPSCTSCHDRPGGALSCGTCHGSAERGDPPRGSCLFPESASQPDAHRVHLGPSSVHARPFACETCHPTRTADFSGSHGDGHVDFAFDPALAGTVARYDDVTRECSVACHDRGGQRSRPSWRDTGPMTCNDCHNSPPTGHPEGPCTNCHAEPDAFGTSLRAGAFHLDGVATLGDGSGTCTACHGTSGDPEGWPLTGSHSAHRTPRNAPPVACGDCHLVPARATDSSHFAPPRGADLNFSGGALARGATPAYAPATRSCMGVACHGAGLGGVRANSPVWGDASGIATQCGQCHSIPPPAPHTSQTNCASVICHGSEVAPSADGPRITESGRAQHQNGVIDYAGVAP